MSLFKQCTKYIVKSTGDKTLHYVTDLNSAEYFGTLCLVKRKRSYWFWKKDKHIPTQIKLDDILLEKIIVDKSKMETKVLLEKFVEAPSFKASGDIGTKIASELHLELNGSDHLEISLDLGNIEKTKINWEMLEEQLQKVSVDTTHPLFSDVNQHKRMNLGLVLETIMTQSEASVKEDADRVASTDDDLPVTIKKTSISVDVHGKGSVESKRVHSFTLPSKTILAYSCNVFSIVDGHKIMLHTSVDTLDENADAPLILSKEESKKATDHVKEEFASLLEDEKFNKLKEKFKLIIGNVSKEVFQHLHILLSIAELNIENKTSARSIDLSEIDSSLKIFEEPYQSFLQVLDFKLPADIHEDNAKIILPKVDENKLLKQCMGFFDCAEDIDESALVNLQNVTSDDLKLLLRIVENETNGTDTFLKDENIKRVLAEEGPAGQFLKKIGFVEITMDDAEVMSYTADRNLLLDTFTVLYVLAN